MSVSTGALNSDTLESGFNEISECIDDFTCDIPKAPEILAGYVPNRSDLPSCMVLIFESRKSNPTDSRQRMLTGCEAHADSHR